MPFNQDPYNYRLSRFAPSPELYALRQSCPVCMSREIVYDQDLNITCQACQRKIEVKETPESQRAYLDLLLMGLMASIQPSQVINEDFSSKAFEVLKEGYEKLIEEEKQARDYFALAQSWHTIRNLHSALEQEQQVLEDMKKEMQTYDQMLSVTDDLDALAYVSRQNIYGGQILSQFLSQYDRQAEEFFQKGLKLAQKALEKASEEEKELFRQNLLFALSSLSDYLLEEERVTEVLPHLEQIAALLPQDQDMEPWIEIKEELIAAFFAFPRFIQTLKEQDREQQAQKLEQAFLALARMLFEENPSLKAFQLWQKAELVRMDQHLEKAEWKEFDQACKNWIRTFKNPQLLPFYLQDLAREGLLEYMKDAITPLQDLARKLQEQGQYKREADVLKAGLNILNWLYKQRPIPENRQLYATLAGDLARCYQRQNKQKDVLLWTQNALKALTALIEDFEDADVFVMDAELRASSMNDLYGFLRERLSRKQMVELLNECMAIYCEADRRKPFRNDQDVYARYLDLIDTYNKLNNKKKAAFYKKRLESFKQEID